MASSESRHNQWVRVSGPFVVHDSSHEIPIDLDSFLSDCRVLPGVHAMRRLSRVEQKGRRGAEVSSWIFLDEEQPGSLYKDDCNRIGADCPDAKRIRGSGTRGREIGEWACSESPSRSIVSPFHPMRTKFHGRNRAPGFIAGFLPGRPL